MASLVALFRSWSHPQVAVLAVCAVGAAGCSSDTTRFNDSPFAARSEATGSVGMPQGQGAPVARVEQSQLPPPAGSYQTASASSYPVSPGYSGSAGTSGSGAYPTNASYTPPRYSPPASSGVSGGGRGMASYAPATSNDIAATPPAAPVRPAFREPPRETAASARPAAIGNGVHVVAPGETLIKIAHHYGRSLSDVAKANRISPFANIKIGDELVIPGMQRTAAAPAVAHREPPKEASRVAMIKPAQPKPEPKASAPKPLAAKPAPAPVAAAAPKAKPPVKQVASVEPTQSANVASTEDAPASSAAGAASGNGIPSFRRPVNGRIIAGFGPKTNGQQNDGVNFAVPEGTPVKAAEDGVVAYAGNELKGYGNLVLVRHSNGYVTAYAHAKELMVKRGDQIRRGQVIAKSGQTGDVDAPQLHFEVRKGPAPLDPMPMISGG
jgi:murein DD-endopeptidase MepM/ murein hydrolase activator NlpD